MLFLPALLLASGASAKLWGWEREFTLVARQRPWKMMDMMEADACAGWDDWCEKSKCTRLEKFDIDLGSVNKKHEQWWEQGMRRVHFDWARVQRKNSAWIDLWRRADGRFDMWENEKGSSPHGFCEVPPGGDNGTPMIKSCRDSDANEPIANDGAETIVQLVCYQY